MPSAKQPPPYHGVLVPVFIPMFISSCNERSRLGFVHRVELKDGFRNDVHAGKGKDDASRERARKNGGK